MNIADVIRERITTTTFCESVGIKLDRHGNTLCPFHGDTNKSLKVYKDPSRGWTCFGCHKGGSVIDFAMLWYGITFRQAVVRLDADFGMNLPLTHRATSEERRMARKELEERRRMEAEAQERVFTAESSFWEVFDTYCNVLSMLDKTRPKRGENDVSDEYANALWILPIIRNEYELALDALEQARKEANGIGSTAKAGGPDRRIHACGLPERGAV